MGYLIDPSKKPGNSQPNLQPHNADALTASAGAVEDDRRLVLEALQDAIVFSTLDGQITQVNHAFMALVDRHEADILGQPLIAFFSSDDECAELVESLSTFGRVRDFGTHLRVDGPTPLPVSISGAYLSGAGGLPAQLMMACRDLRPRLEADRTARELREIQERLHDAEKMEVVGRLAGGVAHDFNNYLTIIHGFASLLSEQVPATLRDDVNEILVATDKGAALTDQLLSLSRRRPVRLEPLDLAMLITALQRILARSVGSKCRLFWDPKGASWPVRVDRAMMERMLVNLAMNARHAMPDGGSFTLSTTCRHGVTDNPELPPGDYIRLSVSDTGCGMSADLKAHVFEPFYTTRAQGEGTGLGLSTCYATARRFGGTITVESVEAMGTTFHIDLPRDLSPATTPAREHASGPETRQTTILIVDDEAPMRRFLTRALSQQGHAVRSAQSGTEALSQLDGIDLVLADVVMPDQDGLELRKAVLGRRPHLPVLLMSGFPEYAQRKNMDPSRILAKPFSPKLLARAIAEALSGARRLRPAEID